jgi:hemolysin activation/secretion protein
LAAQGVSPADQEQARIRAERQAAERAAREAAPIASLDAPAAAALGPFPEEQPCFPVRETLVENADRAKLRWVPGFVARFRGRCVGTEGLSYIIRSLQAEFIERGLVTTRAGLPEQDLAGGTLRITIVPGVVEDVRVNGTDRSRVWSRATPVERGDILDLRALEQGLEQLRSVPGRTVTVDIKPGDAPGGSVLDVALAQPRPFAASLSINNFASERVGRYQGSVQVAELGQLGFSEVISGFYNRRVDAPGVPADSRGVGGSFSVPAGWWTFSGSGSSNRYKQTVEGEVAAFGTRGTLDRVAVAAERVVYRDQTTKSSVSVGVARRWGRNFINDVEIGIQRQDLTDLEVRLIDRRTFGAVRVDGAAGARFGLGILGAQDEPDDRPDALPSARYRIFSADVAVLVPLGRGFVESYRAELHGQVSTENLYGSDLIQVGGPYTVRGLDNDTAVLGRDGYYVRQELGARVADGFRPYALFDFGEVRRTLGVRGGAGIGLRVQRGPVFIDVFGARPVFGRGVPDRKRIRFGLSAGIGI